MRCRAKVLNNDKYMDKWVSVLQTQCKRLFSFSVFINIYKYFYNHFFLHFTFVCCVLQSKGIVQDHNEQNVGGSQNKWRPHMRYKVPCWCHKHDYGPTAVAVTDSSGGGVGVHSGEGNILLPSME